MFMDIIEVISDDLTQISSLTINEIMERKDILLIMEQEVGSEYDEILPRCTLITTFDGNKAYVARIIFHLTCSDKLLYGAMQEYCIEDNKYFDITHLCGNTISATEFCREEKGKLYTRKITYTIPVVQEGNFLFYIACC